MNSKGFFPTPDGDTLIQNSISFKKFPSKIFLKNAWILTYLPKTEFARFFATPGGVIPRQVRIAEPDPFRFGSNFACMFI